MGESFFHSSMSSNDLSDIAEYEVVIQTHKSRQIYCVPVSNRILESTVDGLVSMNRNTVFNSLICEYSKAYPSKNGKVVQCEVSVIWKDIKSRFTKDDEIARAIREKVAELKEKTSGRKIKALSYFRTGGIIGALQVLPNIYNYNCFNPILVGLYSGPSSGWGGGEKLPPPI